MIAPHFTCYPPPAVVLHANIHHLALPETIRATLECPELKALFQNILVKKQHDVFRSILYIHSGGQHIQV